jgi:putative flippase GtrA
MINRLCRYFLIGGFGTVLYISIVTVLVEFVELDPTLSSFGAFLCSIVAAYIPNHYWVYESTRNHSYCFPRFVTVSGAGLLISTGIMYFTVNILDSSYMWGELFVTIVIPLNNYLLNSYWTFK